MGENTMWTESQIGRIFVCRMKITTRMGGFEFVEANEQSLLY